MSSSNAARRALKKQAPTSDIRQESVQSQQEWEDGIKKLWRLLQTTSPENKKKIIESLDEKSITALRTLNNPYKKPVIDDGTNKVLLFSVINLTEKYSQRFAMTTLVGFLYRMLDEYEPEEAKKFVSEKSAKYAELYNAAEKDLKKNKPDMIYRKELEECKKALAALDPKDSNNADELKKLVKQSYAVRAKIIKYQLHLSNEPLVTHKSNVEKLVREVKTREGELVNAKEIYDATKEKYQKRVEYEKGGPEALKGDLEKTASRALETVNKLKTEGKTMEDLTSDERKDIKNQLRQVLTQEEASKSLEDFATMLRNRLAEVSTLESKTTELKKKLEEANAKVSESEAKVKDLNDYFKSLKAEYNEKLTKTKSTSTAMGHPLDKVTIENMELTEEEYDNINADIKKTLGIDQTAEEYTEKEQDKIEAFLNFWLKYNPDNHVRCSYKPNYEDPTRKPITEEDYDTYRSERETKYSKSVLPPDDTFFRWNRYVENNYEELRQACDDIYCEKSDFEFGIVPYKVVEGANEKKVMDEVREYQRKYADEFEADILCAKFFNWNLLGSWAQNREVRDFYNKNTEIIKRILEQNKEDSAMGTKLMKDRATKKKQENVKEAGPDARGLSEIKKQSDTVASLERHGAKPIKDFMKNDAPIPVSSVPRDSSEATDKEVEVGVHVIKPELRAGKRRFRGKTETFKFNIPSEELPEGSMKVMTPQDKVKSDLEAGPKDD
jgi:hypothetical protein